ncbi:MAG: glycosyltransferase family 39 protein, partial [Ginsengibacter sp.]
MLTHNQITSSNTVVLKWLVGLCVFLNLSGIFIPVLGTDGTLYASITKTMVQNNNYLELFSQNKDWLDKPHLPFWITAVFFKIFGIAGWSYKLPGILIMLMGAAYTFHFARRLYDNSTIALWSVIILLTAEHIIISNHDVRAEGFLTGFIIAAVYHFYRTIQHKTFIHLL